MTSPQKPQTADVPSRIFEEFLQTLESAGIQIDALGRLRETLLEANKYSEKALREALFGEEAAE